MSEQAIHEEKRTIGGREVTFRHLSPRDRAAIMKRQREADRAALARRLDDCAVEGDVRFGELSAFDDKAYGQAEWEKFVSGHEGQAEVLLASLRKAHKGEGEAEALLDAMPDRGTLELVATLCGMSVVRVPVADKGEGADPLPPAGEQTPACYERAGAE